MPALPGSVRVALWVTQAWAAGTSTDRAVRAAIPDADVVTGLLESLHVWRDLGEVAVTAALPRSGDVRLLAGSPAETVSAATGAGECLLAPSLGAALVPGWLHTRVHWVQRPAAPVPRHVVEMADPGELRRRLTESVLRATSELDRMGGVPFDGAAAREALHGPAGSWALPERLSPRVRSLVAGAATVWDAAEAGISASGDGLTSGVAGSRTEVLRRLSGTANEVLAGATSAGVAELAGWRP